MGLEAERKFLVHPEKWAQLVKPVGEFYRQGYLLTDPNKTIRVRLTDEACFLTIKGLTSGATRQEFEYEIPKAEAAQLLDLFAENEIVKVRYTISHQGHVWEVDEFLGDNSGLVVAEIELASEAEEFALPDWVAMEVTDDQRYYNSQLSIHPFRNW